ncbi:MAG: YvcK family protein [Kiritimatiellae bacterium]|nr:YvcK family protein [Kiritimatiellia bacterium]
MVREIEAFDARDTRVVILGGGTGMSTVVGGNCAMPDWPDHPFVGLKEEFQHLDVVACTTDDGGSTGLLLKHLPMIGIGDLRKSCVSLVQAEALQQAYGLAGEALPDVVAVIRDVFNYRFALAGADRGVLDDPLLAVETSLRSACPPPLADLLRALGRYAGGKDGLGLDPAGHSLGNLLLTAAVFRATGGGRDCAPGMEALRTGLDEVAGAIGAPRGRLHPATSTPGELVFSYANGVAVRGQRKAAVVRRGVPVESVQAEFVGAPEVSAELLKRIGEADLIVFAPGSVYSSMIPVLQVEPITAAIRANRGALKVLGANFWIQEGETDVSLRNGGRGFLVSELIEAYDDNVPGGVAGLFDVIVCANLENMPGNILRNYALEGKRPIHLDRTHVEAMGLRTIEATVFSREHLSHAQVIHHDPASFARTVKTLLFARDAIGERTTPRPAARPAQGSAPRRAEPLCAQLAAMDSVLDGKSFEPVLLGEVFSDLAWWNRDVRPAHLQFFDGARLVRAADWNRSTEWDNVLGYYDPDDRFLKVHEQLARQPDRLRGDLLIALGESLLGNYIGGRRWIEGEAGGARCYEIRLCPPGERACLLEDEQLHAYLGLARMVPDAKEPLVYRITINNNEGFLPCGLLFGSLFAWYLNNSYGSTMEYEMSLLGWPASTLMPHQAKERARKQALVRFFREEVFGYPKA